MAELERNLAGVRARIGAATLVAVSKTWPASDVLLLHRLGVEDFGENYGREAAAKAAALRAAGVVPRWHFVGGVQRNKCRSIAAYADLVHSVDRPEVATALGAGARYHRRTVGALVQVDYGGGAGRSGCDPADAAALADLVAATDGLALRGVMTVAPPGVPPRPVFAALRELSGRIARDHPGASDISAGMTGDLEDAVAEGATLVRVGTVLFGVRR